MTKEELAVAMSKSKRDIVLKNLKELYELVWNYPNYADSVSYAIEYLEKEEEQNENNKRME